MIDFHSHILPGVDDGAENLDTSITMLSKSYADGVKTIVSTSHCYPMKKNAIPDFLEKREQAYKALTEHAKRTLGDFPKIVPGCELHISEGVCREANLEKLCIEGTQYILLEMPYSAWTDAAFEEVYQISRRGLKPIMAHLDRYIGQESMFHELYSLDVLFQINTSAFLEGKNGKKMLNWFRNDLIHVIGTDTHNLTTRPPNLKECYELIKKNYGWEYVDFLQHNNERILENKMALPTRLPKPNIIKRMFL